MSYRKAECLILVCDDCGAVYEGQDCIMHFDSEAEARTMVEDDRSWRLAGDRAFCEDCGSKYKNWPREWLLTQKGGPVSLDAPLWPLEARP